MRNGSAWSTEWWISLVVVSFLATAVAASDDIVIENCRVFEPESGRMLPERTIVIHGSRIVSVAEPDDVDHIPNDALRIDGNGKFLLPGLIDAHVHVVHVLDFTHVTGDEVLPLYLAAGVTSVRSTRN